jgi:hypothetical protein
MVGPRNTDTHRLRGVIQRLLKSNPAAMGQPDARLSAGHTAWSLFWTPHADSKPHYVYRVSVRWQSGGLQPQWNYLSWHSNSLYDLSRRALCLGLLLRSYA